MIEYAGWEYLTGGDGGVGCGALHAEVSHCQQLGCNAHQQPCQPSLAPLHLHWDEVSTVMRDAVILELSKMQAFGNSSVWHVNPNAKQLVLRLD